MRDFKRTIKLRWTRKHDVHFIGGLSEGNAKSHGFNLRDPKSPCHLVGFWGLFLAKAVNTEHACIEDDENCKKVTSEFIKKEIGQLATSFKEKGLNHQFLLETKWKPNWLPAFFSSAIRLGCGHCTARSCWRSCWASELGDRCQLKTHQQCTTQL